jgi:small-conductance mechanosensitive channel
MNTNIIYAVTLMVAGLIIARLTSKSLTRYLDEKFNVKNAAIIGRLSFYGLLVLFVLMALHQLGFELSILLGAAGIFSVAIGFASQTSMSNVISGLFLLGEHAFAVGDTIKVGSTMGEVISIDWLSIKLRTPDNTFVRIPNEVLIKSEMTNLTRFEIRRFDLNLSVAYKEDIARVKSLLLDLVDHDPQCLEDPEPMVVFESFADSGILLRLAVWAKTQDFIKFKSYLSEQVKQLLDQHNIEIPFPHVSLYAGSASQPIRIAMVADEQASSVFDSNQDSSKR